MFDKLMNKEDMLMYGVLVDEMYTGGDELYDRAFLVRQIDKYKAMHFIYMVDDCDEGLMARLIVFDSVGSKFAYILMHKGCGNTLIDEMWEQLVN